MRAAFYRTRKLCVGPLRYTDQYQDSYNDPYLACVSLIWLLFRFNSTQGRVNLSWLKHGQFRAFHNLVSGPSISWLGGDCSCSG